MEEDLMIQDYKKLLDYYLSASGVIEAQKINVRVIVVEPENFDEPF